MRLSTWQGGREDGHRGNDESSDEHKRFSGNKLGRLRGIPSRVK
jgi:hypothetical protein